MKKITFYPKGANDFKMDALQRTSERVTIQLRKYDDNGEYQKNDDKKSNQTIIIKGIPIEIIYEKLKSLLVNDEKHIAEYFEVDE